MAAASPAPAGDRRAPAPRPAPPKETAAPSILLAAEPAPVPGRVAMIPASPEGAAGGPASGGTTSASALQPPRTDGAVQATLARYAGSFEACVAEARRGEPELVASPRPVVITMVVRPNGRVAYPTLDDAVLAQSALGGCLKRQASAMVFSEAGGEPVRVTMPLVLGP